MRGEECQIGRDPGVVLQDSPRSWRVKVEVREGELSLPSRQGGTPTLEGCKGIRFSGWVSP